MRSSNQRDVPGVFGPDPLANSPSFAGWGALRRRLSEDSSGLSAHCVASSGVPSQIGPRRGAKKEPLGSLSAGYRENRVPSPFNRLPPELLSGCSGSGGGRKACGTGEEGVRMLPAAAEFLARLL